MKKWLVVLTIVSIFMGSQKVVRAVAVTGTCEWCGATCQRTTIGQMCMDVTPPTGKICIEENGACVIKSTIALPTLPEEKAVDGEAFFYLKSVNTINGTEQADSLIDLGVESNAAIGGIDIWLTFNPDLWQLMTVESLSGPDDNFVFNFRKDMVRIDNNKGTVDVYMPESRILIPSPASATFKQPLLRFGFKTVKTGTQSVNFVCQNGMTTDSNIYDTKSKDMINCSKNIPFGGRVILPIVTDTVIPTQGQVGCVKGEGDASGDDKVDLVDFGIWKSEYLATIKAVQSKADFNCDGKVDLVDFGIWKSEYLKN